MSLAALAMEEAPDSPRRIVFEVSVKAAERIALALDEEEETAPLTVALFDLGGARVESSIYLPANLAPDFVLGLISEAANGEELASLRVESVEDQDWVTLSQQQRGAVRAGRFIIHGSHERDQHSRYAIEIDAGQAFGTAHHASTQGCLIMLDHISKRRRFAKVLDLGTGAGTLAIAASRLSRRKVLASDSDRIAVTVAAENARKNHAGALVDVVTAMGFGRPLFELAPLLARRMRARGSIILSGITEAQGAALQARFISLGFVLKRRVVIDSWTTLLMAKRR
jgi:ribosomal protein L11 methyltransferase